MRLKLRFEQRKKTAKCLQNRLLLLKSKPFKRKQQTMKVEC